MILLDTNVVVAHLNGHAAVTAKISSHIEEIAVPALVVAELDYEGVHTPGREPCPSFDVP